MIYSLYKIQVFFANQRHEPEFEPIERSDLLLSAFYEPLELRGGVYAQRLSLESDDSIVFNFASTRPSTRASFEEPPTLFLDPHEQTCVIVADLPDKGWNTARRLPEFIDRCSAARRYEAEATVTPVYDPDNLIKLVQEARAVTRLKFTIPRPNSWPSYRILDGASRDIASAGAKEAAVELRGDDIDRGVGEVIVLQTAALGLPAEASIVLREGGKTKKRLSEDPLIVTDDSERSFEEIRANVGYVRSKYHSILKRLEKANGHD